ncbi:hypothetical protein BACCIP111895_01335 [Neobacillus rhizosphaerae]|uniref:Uncharacterized protein n=1 Tax=Neobacillus rhizosphaerae TaxID=2880965 RepID=A0ABN8KL74_9BACI|nr:hypothetical protein [Neobacillus rhizosphaerae]CAH2714181.1 hypothetical protein BACCIP111895_01335 [Neobacillus rhizosphaerae]
MSKNINYDNNNYFCYIGAFSDEDYKAFSLILDTQTAIMLERFYYNPQKLKNDVNVAITDFLLETINKDKVPGFAMQESCWDRSLASINSPQFNRLEKALNDMNSWDRDKIINHSKSNGIPFNDFVMREKVSFTETMIPHLKSNPMLLGSYVIMLKIHLLNFKKSKMDKFKLFREFADFMNQDIKIFHAVEFSLAVDYFLGNSNKADNVQSLLKFGSKDPLGAILTSCWDLFFLRFLQLSFMNNMGGIIKPKLVSRDDALINLAMYSSIHGLIEVNDTPMPIVSFDHEGLNITTMNFLDGIQSEIRNSVVSRSQAFIGDIEGQAEKITQIAIQLELELLSKIK